MEHDKSDEKIDVQGTMLSSMMACLESMAAHLPMDQEQMGRALSIGRRLALLQQEVVWGKKPMEHDNYCNCEDCWWARDQREICPTCGCIVGAGCPCGDKPGEGQSFPNLPVTSNTDTRSD